MKRYTSIPRFRLVSRRGTRRGEFRGYTYLYTHFLPRLEPAQIPVLMWENPRVAFGV